MICSSFKGERNATLKHTSVSHNARDFCHHVHVPDSINCLRTGAICKDFCVRLLYSSSCGYGTVWTDFAGFSISRCNSFLYYEMEVSRAPVPDSELCKKRSVNGEHPPHNLNQRLLMRPV